MHSRFTKKWRKASRRGAALLMALGMLAIFSVLGAAYLQYALIGSEEMDLTVQEVRARAAAEGGIRAGLAKILATPESAVGELALPLNIYGAQQVGGDVNGMRVVNFDAALTNVRARASVTISAVDPATPAGAWAAIAPAIKAGGGKWFQLTSEGVIAKWAGDREYNRVTAHTEALLVVRADGYEWVYWHTGSGSAAAEAKS